MIKLNKKDVLRVVSFIVLMHLIGLTTIAAIFNFADWKLDFLGINPNDELHQKLMHLEYPPTSVSGSIIINYPNDTIIGMPMMSLDVALEYNGTLTEETPVNLGANGFVYEDGIDKIVGILADNKSIIMNYAVLLGFERADFNDKATDKFSLPFGQVYVELTNDENATKIHYSEPIQPLEVLQTIKWDTEGEYSPYIQILFRNGTSITTTYTQYKIPVHSPTVVTQERYSRVNTWLSISLFFFALVELPKLLVKLLPKKIRKILTID